MAEMKSAGDLLKSSLTDRIKYVVEHAAARLAPDIGRQLLTLIEPSSLATMAAVLTIWTGAQFFGVGEIADTVLLIGGWAMFGGAVLQAAKLLFQCAQLTVQPASLSDLDKAAGLLAETVAILGVQGTLAILLRKPSNALKDQFFADRNNPMPFSWKTFKDLPNNRWWGYKPSVQGTKTLDAGVGGTDVYTGDIEYSIKGNDADRRLALAHEQVHQFLTPKLNVLRRLRTFMRAQGYNRSYLLRYLEEAVAETTAQLREKGLAKDNLIEGIRFPVGIDYMISVGKCKCEARQIFLGPITVGGMTYQLWAARRSQEPKKKQ